MRILWVDDEIEGLRAHIRFLENRGIEVLTASHPDRALEVLEHEVVDLVLLDYRMPGMNGEELYKILHGQYPNLPIAFLTMVEDPEVMALAGEAGVVGYVVKPFRPSQILALVERVRPQTPRRVRHLSRELARLGQAPEDWLERASLLAQWAQTPDEVFHHERKAQNSAFARWMERAYPDLLDSPFLLHRALAREVFPPLREGEKVVFMVMDGLRLEQFLGILQHVEIPYRTQRRLYFSLLPSATPFSRNALFAGLLPRDLHRLYPGILEANTREDSLLEQHLEREGLADVVFRFRKWLRPEHFDVDWMAPFEVVVVSFFDWLSHVWQKMPFFRDVDFRRFVEFLMKETSLRKTLEEALRQGYRVVLTSDHGWVEARQPVVIRAGRETTGGLRYKWGQSLRVLRGKVLEIRDRDFPQWGLPRIWGDRLFLAIEDGFLVYESDPRKFARTYRDWLFHGGVSLEEMVVPVIHLLPRGGTEHP